MSRAVAIALMLLVVASMTPGAISQDSTPGAIKIQGYLSEYVSGQKQPANGTYSMTFDLYDSASEGTLLVRDGPQAVEVRDGIWEAYLHFNHDRFSEGYVRWVEVTVGSEVLAPRIHVVSTPYGYVADMVDGYEGADLEESDEIAAGDAQLQTQVEALGNDLAAHESSPTAHPGYVLKNGDVMTGALSITTSDGTPLRLSTTESTARVILEGGGGAWVRTGPEGATDKTMRVSASSSSLWGAHMVAMGRDTDLVGTGGGTLLLASAGESTSGDILLRTQGSDRMIVDQVGNVGIGTSSPAQRLDVLGSSNTGYAARIRNGGGDGRGLSIQAGDNDSTNDMPLLWVGNYDGTESRLRVSSKGTTRVTVLEITGGADIAEPFEVTGDVIPPPGTVMIIDEDNPGRLKFSDRAYDRRVAGVISGAGGIAPGLTLRHQNELEGQATVALAGKVYTLATASNGSIRPGDLLTTSSTPGHAMRLADAESAHGAVIGKAMSTLDSGEGLVLVLVNLQ